MCSSWAKEETVTVSFTESEARELVHFIKHRVRPLQWKLQDALSELEKRREPYRNWSA